MSALELGSATRITATITGCGTSSACPDDPNAVDAAIEVDGLGVGDCTLKIDQYSGRLSAWGDMEMWATHELIQWFHAGSGADRIVRSERIGDVVEAVREAFVS